MNSFSLVGRRIQIAGSSDEKVEVENLWKAHEFVRSVVRKAIRSGLGFVVTLGNEPIRDSSHGLSIIFDWTVLEEVSKNTKSVFSKWPGQQGKPVVCVGFANWRQRIPNSRMNLWNDLVRDGIVELQVVQKKLGFGGVLRARQSSYGDILLTLGGGIGVDHLVELYRIKNKQAIPLDFPLRLNVQSTSERLYDEAIQAPHKFFHYVPLEGASASFSSLSAQAKQSPDELANRLLDFVSHLSRPKAFYIRLLDRKSPHFSDVERFFRNVVDDVVRAAGYEKFEMGSETTPRSFLNTEIFTAIGQSALVIADLTGKRANCFTELGFALGSAKRTIVTARDGTKLPFDTASLPCFFWGIDGKAAHLQSKLRSFMATNINRKSIAEDTFI